MIGSLDELRREREWLKTLLGAPCGKRMDGVCVCVLGVCGSVPNH